MNGKHSSDEAKEFDINFSLANVKRIVQVVCIILAVITFIACAILILNTMKNNTGVISTSANDNLPNNAQENSIMPNKVGNFKVLGKLVIDKVNLEQYILEKTNEESLKLGLTKLYGETINMTGNFCITGHNTEGMFKNLNNLEKEDTFYIEDTKGKKVTYKVYDKYSVQSDDLKCLMPNEKEKEVTLITCEQGAQTKLVIKAKETKETKKKEQTKNETSSNTVKNNTSTEKTNTTSENKVTTENILN